LNGGIALKASRHDALGDGLGQSQTAVCKRERGRVATPLDIFRNRPLRAPVQGTELRVDFEQILSRRGGQICRSRAEPEAETAEQQACTGEHTDNLGHKGGEHFGIRAKCGYSSIGGHLIPDTETSQPTLMRGMVFNFCTTHSPRANLGLHLTRKWISANPLPESMLLA
jgi:hypothetical protein